MFGRKKKDKVKAKVEVKPKAKAKAKSKEIKIKEEAKTPVETKEVEAEVKAPKLYMREGATPIEIVSCEEILLNGRKCHRVILADGTSDIVSESDDLGRLVW